MDPPHPTTPLPVSAPPESGTSELALEGRLSESGMRAALPTVAICVADQKLYDRLSVLLQLAGRATGRDELLAVAAAVITDGRDGATSAVTRLRASTRSDAAIIVVLSASAPEVEARAAYEAGAVLCLRAPLDEHQLVAAIGSAIDLHTAKVQADDLLRRLDVHTHLASLGRVTAGFTHEVSNPLAVLAMNFEMVRENVEWLLQARDLLSRPTAEATRVAHERMSHVSTPDLRVALSDMGAALDRIKGVLTTAREFAQAGSGCRIEEVDLIAVVHDARRWAAGELHGIAVQELIDGPFIARADQRLLGQIVLNLVTNAAHAARQLPSPRVRFHVYGSEDIAILSVRDNGPGVPPEIRDKIFEPFFTTRRDQGGTGLGLALCREYAAQMQAQLTLWTAPGRGACFRIHMPAAG
jgi:signal transduction histidine kinase